MHRYRDSKHLQRRAVTLCLQVRIDNENPNHTVLIIDSANRPGTLVEVSQPAQCRADVSVGAGRPAWCACCRHSMAKGSLVLGVAPALPLPLAPVQVVQCLTELGLAVVKARISSDGGWFVDGEALHSHSCSSRGCLGAGQP